MLIKPDGSYPVSFDSCVGPWQLTMPLSEAAARLLLTPFRENSEKCKVDAILWRTGSILMNKCFRVFQEEDGKLFGVYLHDGDFFIIECAIGKARRLSLWDMMKATRE